VGRLIPAGTGFAHHAERRRTREQDFADQLKELEENQLAEAALAEAAEVAAGAEEETAAGAEEQAAAGAEEQAPADVVAAVETDAAPEGGEETTTA